MKRAAIVGYGNMGSLYAEKIYGGKIDGLALYGIVCRNPARGEEIGRRLPGTVIFPDEDSMLREAGRFDAVIITTPHREHVGMVRRAGQAGLHVLCEKPLGIAAGECAAGLGGNGEAAPGGGGYEEPAPGIDRYGATAPGIDGCGAADGLGLTDPVCAMIFHWRAKEIYRRTKALLEAGCLGRLHMAVWTANFWYRPEFYHHLSSWRSSWRGEGGGLLINQSQHLLDMWNWLFGQPSEVCARIGYGVYSGISVDDRISLLFSHPGGMEGTLLSSTGDSPGSNRLEIHGELGKLVVEQERTLTVCRNERSTAEVSRSAREANPVIPFSEERWEAAQERDEYETVLQNFSDAMHGKAAPLAGLEDGMRALEDANAAYLSDWRQERVKIPCDEGAYLRGLEERQREERSL